jgi:hypothetical protein
MNKLEDLRPHAAVRGILPDSLVTDRVRPPHSCGAAGDSHPLPASVEVLRVWP